MSVNPAQNSEILKSFPSPSKAAQAKLSAKYQISIPKQVREAQNWQAGQDFVFIPKGKGILMIPAPDRSALCGLVPGGNSENYRDRNDRF